MPKEFEDLSDDLKKENIPPFLDDRSLAALAQVNRDLNALTQEELQLTHKI